MITQKLVVVAALGLHLRPAGKISEVSLQYQSKVQIQKGTHIANAKSILGLLAAKIQQGDEIEVICDGEDEIEALKAIVDVLRADELCN